MKKILVLATFLLSFFAACDDESMSQNLGDPTAPAKQISSTGSDLTEGTVFICNNARFGHAK